MVTESTVSTSKLRSEGQKRGHLNKDWRSEVGRFILEHGSDPGLAGAKITEAREALNSGQFPKKKDNLKNKPSFAVGKNTEALGEWALSWDDEKRSPQEFAEELANQRAATRMYNSIGELRPDAIKSISGGSVDWFPAALATVTDPELVSILTEYNTYFSDKQEAGLLPEGTTSISSLRQGISTALIGGAIATAAGKGEATRLIRYLDRLAIGDSVRLQKAEKGGVVELNTIASGIIDAPNWETALNTAGSDAEILVTIGDTFNIRDRLPTGAVYLPVANAFRLLERNRLAFVGKSPAEKSDLIRKVGWNILGLPNNPMAHSPAEKYVDLAKMIWEMTWRTAKLGDKRVNYAWKTMNFAKSIPGDAGVHDLFKTGPGLVVLQNEVKVTDFWELVANSLDDPAVDPSRTNARNVGLMTLVGGRPQMVASFEAVMVENIPFDKIKAPLLTTTASDGKKADAFRAQTAGYGFLHTAELDKFMIAIQNQDILTHLDGPKRAQSIVGLFEVMLDYGLALGQKGRIREGLGPYDTSLPLYLENLRDGCGLDFTDNYTRSEFMRLKSKYAKYFSIPGLQASYHSKTINIGGALTTNL